MLINCDMGESYGNFRIGNDEMIMPHIDLCNIACGFHAGDPVTIYKTILLAKNHGVKIGAHPGYPDLQGFGRRSLAMNKEELKSSLLYQVGALYSMTESVGLKLHHVKPHGALYHDMAFDEEKSAIMCEVIAMVNPMLTIITYPESILYNMATDKGIEVMGEAFADRRYNSNKTLVSRKNPDAIISEPEEAALQVMTLQKENKVNSVQGITFHLEADTVCVHGDHPGAIDIVMAISQVLSR